MNIDFRYQSIEINKEKVVTSINIDFRYQSIMIDLSIITDYYRLL